MKYLITIFLALFNIGATSIESNDSTPNKTACAILLEKDVSLKKRIDKMGCKKGDPIMFYRHTTRGKWEFVLPIRVAALAVCDVSKPISEGSYADGSYNSLICTFSGEFRQVNGDEKYQTFFDDF